MRAVLVLVVVCAAVSAVNAQEGIGNGLWRTFGFEVALPVNISEASAAGWYKVGGCDENQGIVFAQTDTGASEVHPLELMFTSGGQIAGARVTIYGSSDTSSIGNAAQPQLIQEGFWIPVAGESKTWYMTVSFRAPETMCSGEIYSDMMGDRLVINQGTIDWNIPLSAQAANDQGFVPGACMKTMGQHWMYDLSLGNGQLSWVEGNLLPIVPMYWPPTIDGQIHAIFFTTPVAQPGAALFGHGDWETPALTASLMCQNFCAKDCHWTTWFWSTMHIYLNSDWESATCPGGSGLVGRSCPSD